MNDLTNFETWVMVVLFIVFLITTGSLPIIAVLDGASLPIVYTMGVITTAIYSAAFNLFINELRR